MSDKKSIGAGGVLVVFIISFVAVAAAFYGLDHFVMGIQGLPLNLDLTPAQ